MLVDLLVAVTDSGPEQEELPGYVGLAIGGVLATYGGLGIIAPLPVNVPLVVAGGVFVAAAVGYLLVLLWIASIVNNS